MKTEYLFVVSNLNIIVQEKEKTPEHTRFVSCFKNEQHRNIKILKLGCCFPQP